MKPTEKNTGGNTIQTTSNRRKFENEKSIENNSKVQTPRKVKEIDTEKLQFENGGQTNKKDKTDKKQRQKPGEQQMIESPKNVKLNNPESNQKSAAKSSDRDADLSKSNDLQPIPIGVSIIKPMEIDDDIEKPEQAAAGGAADDGALDEAEESSLKSASYNNDAPSKEPADPKPVAPELPEDPPIEKEKKPEQPTENEPDAGEPIISIPLEPIETNNSKPQ